MYQARRRGIWFNGNRKTYKKARWLKSYEREADRVKIE